MFEIKRLNSNLKKAVCTISAKAKSVALNDKRYRIYANRSTITDTARALGLLLEVHRCSKKRRGKKTDNKMVEM